MVLRAGVAVTDGVGCAVAPGCVVGVALGTDVGVAVAVGAEVAVGAGVGVLVAVAVGCGVLVAGAVAVGALAVARSLAAVACARATVSVARASCGVNVCALAGAQIINRPINVATMHLILVYFPAGRHLTSPASIMRCASLGATRISRATVQRRSTLSAPAGTFTTTTYL